jgi:hypothetical protein
MTGKLIHMFKMLWEFASRITIPVTIPSVNYSRLAAHLKLIYSFCTKSLMFLFSKFVASSLFRLSDIPFFIPEMSAGLTYYAWIL